MNHPGIYKLLCAINNKCYIGSAVNIKNRFYDHRFDLTRNTHKNKYLQNAWNKHGEENFKFEVLEEVPDKSKLIEREQCWIDFYKSANSELGYNICPKAGNSLGYKHTQKTKDFISKLNSGRILTQEQCKKISLRLKGTRLGKENPFFGKTLSQDSKNKISKAVSLAKTGVKRQSYLRKLSQNINKDEFKNLINQGYTTKQLIKYYKFSAGSLYRFCKFYFPELLLIIKNNNKIFQSNLISKLNKSRKGIPLTVETRNAISNSTRGKTKTREHVMKVELKRALNLNKITLETYNRQIGLLNEKTF